MISAHADLEQDLLAVCRRFRDRSQYLEVRVEEAASTDFAFQGHELETLNRREERGGDVRALVDGAWGFTSFNRLDQLDEMAAAAVDQAKLAGGGPVKLAPADPVQDRVLLPESAQAEEQTLAEKVARLRALNELILGFGAPITTSTAYYADRRARIWLGTSEGTAIHQERLDVTAALVATAAAEGRVQSRSFSTGSSADASLPELDEEQAVSVCRECAGLFRAPKPKAGDYLVVVDPRLAGVFAHEAIGHLSEADHLHENPQLRQVMTLGAELGVPELEIYDTGLVAGSRGALRYDEEGVAAGRTDLIKGGRVVGRLHSRETAGAMGELPTGNARAISYRYPPIVRMRTTVIGPGRATRAEIFRGIDRGLYCVGSMGGQTNGEMFTFSAALAYLIENGEPGELVRDVTLTGNTFTTLKNIEAIEDTVLIEESGGGCGKAGQGPLPVGDGGPHLRVRGVRIGGD
ncbi:MAG: TldD/PmbA family protein [Chloroflexi bacterium]|nr:MAG: TldD/PmbA family protein [Chloroflexota bacterium]TME17528.1 MAG: TldD/PmbA family protein [Chloroflexota bacterium]TME19539.1 MAG: TldD/PmbA family protein [Chloroflexota bacterium]